MNAAVLHAPGKSPRYEVFSEPSPNEKEVIVNVSAAALKPVDKQMASGSHYAAFREFPVVCGIDGVGKLTDGSRVFFAAPRQPYGAMAERTVVVRPRCVPIPDSVDDITAAAVFNPGLSAWGALVWRAQLAAGESVLILGATGVTGKLAIQTAKLRGAARVVAAGRNVSVLRTLQELGADATIRIGDSREDLEREFASASGQKGFDVIIDYVWGPPTEALLAAVTRKDFGIAASRVRLVQVGESAASTISLPAATLRSTRLEILGAGSGSAPTSIDMWNEAIRWLMQNVSSGALRIETEPVPLAQVEEAWTRSSPGPRIVLVP